MSLLKKRKLDPAPAPSTHTYFVTLTAADNLLEHEDAIVQWHRTHSEKTLLVPELHADGRTHYHSIIHTMDKTTNQVTRKLLTLYQRLNIPVVKGVSIIVKASSDAIGLLHYVTKDLQGDPLLITGWTMSWIKETCKANLKNIPYRMLTKNKYTLQHRSSVELVVQYAYRSGYPLTGKASFIQVVTAMQADGYQFSGIKPTWLYAEVMAVCGYAGAARSLWDLALMGLD